MKKLLLLLTIGVFAAAGFGAYTEDFEDFPIESPLENPPAASNWLMGQGWSNLISSVATDTSGEYDGGIALKSTSATDKWPQHTTDGVDFNLALDGDGIVYGFDMSEGATTLANLRMFLRQGATANYAPSFGLGNGVTGGSNFGRITLRTNGEGGTNVEGNNFSGSAYHGVYWQRGDGVPGDWLRFRITLTGENFNIATIYCYNLTTGVEIPTGIVNYDTGRDIKSIAANLNRFIIRGGTAHTWFDNLYVADYYAPAPPEPGFYIEDFEALELGSIDQPGWHDNAPTATVVTTSSSGEYIGGQALRNNDSQNKWPQYAQDRNEDFGLQVGYFDGIEMGYDLREAGTSLTNCRMLFRQAITANYSPSFGINNGAFVVRPTGEAGATITGSTLSDASSEGLWAHGNWINLRLVLRGDDYKYATLYAYNLTTGVDIPTGITNVNLDRDIKTDAANWSRLMFRMGTSSNTTVDNAYITDYIHDGSTAEDPSPADGAFPVSIDEPLILSWLTTAATDSSKVYFGTSPEDLEFEVETTDDFYELPYQLEKSTTYYWRVDLVVAGDDNEGIVWSFTTELEPLNYPRRMAYEGFEYEPYLQLSQGTNGNGGFGWASSWERAEGGWCYVMVGPGSLDPAMDYLLGTRGNRVQHVAGGNNDGAMRKLEYPIDMRYDQDYYISYLAMGDDNEFNAVSLSLWNSKNGHRFLGSHMYYDGYVNLTSPKFSLRDDTGNWQNETFGTWNSGEVYVIVVKISASTEGSDTVYMSAFSASNPLPIEEPTEWDASFTTENSGVYPWIELSGRADSFDQWNIDEIHIGTGWGAVTGWASACGDFGTIMPWDFNEDCQINYGDISVLANDWMRCTDPALEGCEWVIDESDPNFVALFTRLDSAETNVYETDGITIDGDLSEWAGSRWYNSRFNSGFNHQNAFDVTEAKLAMKWNPAQADKVYLAVRVKDTNQSFADDPTAWNDGENIEIRFTVNDTSTDTLWWDNSTFDTAQLYQIFPLDGGGAYANLGGIGTARDAGVYTDLEYAVAVSGDEIHYEIAIPAYIMYNIAGQSGTTATLADGDVIAFNIQINSVNDELSGGLFNNQDPDPQEWAKFNITANSSLELGDMGFFRTDLDKDGVVGLSDLAVVINRWLSCTDPEIEGCDQPWLP